MRNRYLKIFNAFLLLCYFIIIPNNLFGYDNEKDGVHERISRNAWKKAIQQRDFLQDLGLTETGLLTGKKPVDWIAEGSRVEDNLPRPRHHFYDPVSKKGLHDTCGLPFIGGYPSPNWALGIEGGNEWDIKDARKYEYIALAGKDSGGNIVQDAQDDNGRKKYFGMMFRALGQVIHVLEDSAQPEHVRNDAHVFPWDVSLYENYTFENVKELDYTGYILVKLPSFYSYFDTGDGKGLSEFTNRNFVSRSTNFDDRGWCRQKAGIYAEPTPDYAHDEDETVPLPEGGTKTFAVHYIGNKVNDRLTGEEIRNDYLSALSWWNFETESEYSEKVYSLNDKCYDSMANFTIPRAVGYSAGLLNYFFRGEMDMEKDKDNPDQYNIKNLSGESMSGTVRVLYDDKSGNRKEVWSGDWGTGSSPIKPKCKKSGVTFTAPTDAEEPGKYILVLDKGKIGEEEGAVAGKVINTNTMPTGSAAPAITGSNTADDGNCYAAGSGTGPYQWSISKGTIDENGCITITGQCGTATITVTDACGNTGTRDLQLPDTLEITGPDAGCYAVTGTGPYIWDITKGLIDAKGCTNLKGQCGQATINVTDANGCTGTKELNIPAEELTITGSDTTTRNSTKQYTATGCGQVEWSISPLNKGATITQIGLLTTTGTACGSFTITANCPTCGTSATKDVRVTDAGMWLDRGPYPVTCKIKGGTYWSGCIGELQYKGKYRYEVSSECVNSAMIISGDCTSFASACNCPPPDYPKISILVSWADYYWEWVCP
ncbi:MAG: YD repeat-containing protein [Nitrospirae bacterium]|nr:MAG: YD repeat-containing protein [Nitrospirota bacterium]